MMRNLILATCALAVLAGGTFWFIQWSRDISTLTLPGTVEIQEVRLGSKLGGRVEAVFAREGERVAAGKELVRFETPELDAQLIQLQARKSIAEADLKKAREGPRPQEKDEAKAMLAIAEAKLQKAVNGFREEQKRETRSEVEAAEAELTRAKSEFARLESLSRNNSPAVTRSDLDTARAARDSAQKRTEMARARYDTMMNGSRPEDIAEAAGDVARAKAHYELLLAGTRPEDITVAEATLHEIEGKIRENEVNRREAQVRAPGAAILEILAVRPGDLMAPNQAVARILRDDDLWIKVFVAEPQLGRVRVGQSVEVSVDSHPGKKFSGTIEQIANASEFTPRNVQSAEERRHQVFAVKVRVDNSNGVFKSGMAAEVTLPLNDK
ncbi:MAG: efflux RND transporter periplasmic adaptor subunit [Gemmataceae bacterium]